MRVCRGIQWKIYWFLNNKVTYYTKYGTGKVGTLSDGTKVVARQGSTTGGPTLEIKVSNSKVYKIRY